jgi:serine/threonine protein phosphatase PrpC
MDYISKAESIKGQKFAKNEDHFLIKEDIGLHIVCDGIGEDGRGAIASQMTTDFIGQVMTANKKVFQEYKLKQTPELKIKITELVEQAVNKISLQILSTIANDPARKQMGTTLSMVLIAADGVFMAHIGNSRVYLIRDEDVHLLTEDHVSKKSNSSKNDKLEIELDTHGLSANALTRMLGANQLQKVDMLFFEVMPGDSLVLMTDGVSNCLNNKKIFEIMKENQDYNTAKAFLNYVNKINNKENATAITISFIDLKKKSEALTPQDKFQTLQQIPIFSQLDYKEMAKLMDVMKAKKILKDENIVIEGEQGSELFIIVKGEAEVLINKKNIANLSAGNYFGELSLIDNEPRSATVKATTNLDVLVLAKKDFYHLLTHEPQISVKILWRFAQTLTERMRAADIRLSLINSEKTSTDLFKNIELEFD